MTISEPIPEATEAQIKAMGEIVASNIGGHMQSGLHDASHLEGAVFYLHVKLGPRHAVKYHYIDPDGTVRVNNFMGRSLRQWRDRRG